MVRVRIRLGFYALLDTELLGPCTVYHREGEPSPGGDTICGTLCDLWAPGEPTRVGVNKLQWWLQCKGCFVWLVHAIQ